MDSSESGVRSPAPGLGGFEGSPATGGRPDHPIEEGTGSRLPRPPVPDAGPGLAAAPRTPVRTIIGTVLPLDRDDVDTDQIIPKQFLKRIERSGFGPFLFYDWAQDPNFVLNRPEHRGASVLVAGRNFGCGSSREHAPWALEDRGFKAVIAPSFADIFRGNCTKIGLLAVVLAGDEVRTLLDLATSEPATAVTVDLERQAVTAAGFEATFDFDPFTKTRLLDGVDDIGLTERHQDAIAGYEKGRSPWQPRLAPSTLGTLSSN